MARINQGILGGGSGKVGNVTLTSWKGIDIVKGRPLSVANPRTSGQVNQRSRFATCVAFASAILASLIIPLMNRFAVKMSGYNMFVGINQEFFTGELLTEPQNLNFGRGKLGGTPIQVLEVDGDSSTVTISWDNVLDNQFKLATDEAYYLISNAETNEVMYQGTKNIARSVGTDVIATTNPLVTGVEYNVYLIFRRNDGTMIGNTAFEAQVAIG